MADNKLNIPGLITGKKTLAEKHLSDAELQKQRLDFIEAQKYSSKQDKLKALQNGINNSIPDSMTSTYHMTQEEIMDKFGIQVGDGLGGYVDLNKYGSGTGFPAGPGGGYIFPQQQPYQQPLELDDYKKFFPPYQEPKKYGPSPSRTGTGTQDWERELMKQLKPKKSAFEEILDMLFTLPEKEQFLIDIGYMLDVPEPNASGYVGPVKITRKLADGTIKTISNSLDDLFLKEITVKFKNLLLAKATLKLKL